MTDDGSDRVSTRTERCLQIEPREHMRGTPPPLLMKVPIRSVTREGIVEVEPPGVDPRRQVAIIVDVETLAPEGVGCAMPRCRGWRAANEDGSVAAARVALVCRCSQSTVDARGKFGVDHGAGRDGCLLDFLFL